ncbi:MAG: KH domain-containing protein [Candidatus ainarchaeum sp.]|nr:KH domain-containing protein [Candidatus ainarchaeum sp.]
MKTPICESCAKSGELCAACGGLLQEGRISELDVTVSRLLARLSAEHGLGDADFFRAIDLGKVVLVLTRGDPGLLIGREGKVVAEISAAVGKKVRIAEAGGDMRKTVSDIIFPARVSGVNAVYREGREEFKVRIPRGESHHLPMDAESLARALKAVFGSEVAVELE